jgi:hypothetical protein
MLAEFISRLDPHNPLGMLYSAFVRGTEPKEGKYNNQQEHPKSIFNYFWNHTHKSPPFLRSHEPMAPISYVTHFHHARPFLDAAVTQITARWFEAT